MKKKKLLTVSVGVLLVAALLFAGIPTVADDAPTVHYDVLIVNGTVVDGTGAPGYQADVGITDGKIVAIGKLAKGKAERIIDAEGLVVAPGFIDPHGGISISSRDGSVRNPQCLSKIYDGVTTLISGEGSVAPRPYDPDRAFCTLAEAFRLFEESGISCNYASFVNHGKVRSFLLGNEDREPTEAELQVMKFLVAEAMEDGALGLASMLVYTPECYSTTELVIELAKVAAKYGGTYRTHIRGEDIHQLEPGLGTAEMVQICEEAGLPVVQIHFKAPGPEFYELGMLQQTIDYIDEARAEGLDVQAHLYPYMFGATGLSAIIPPWEKAGLTTPEWLALLEKGTDSRARIRAEIYEEIPAPVEWFNFVMDTAGGDFSKLGFRSSPTGTNAAYVGMFFDEIAELKGYPVPPYTLEDAIEVIFDILIEEHGGGGLLAPAYFEESQIELCLQQPWMAIGSDAGARDPATGGLPHPRAYGTFARVLGEYSRERGVITLEDAVYKMTGLPCEQIGITDRGKIEVGLAGDITVFDPLTVKDKATYTEPLQYSEGIPYVIVNGVVVIDDGEHTGALPGKILRLTEM